MIDETVRSRGARDLWSVDSNWPNRCFGSRKELLIGLLTPPRGHKNTCVFFQLMKVRSKWPYLWTHQKFVFVLQRMISLNMMSIPMKNKIVLIVFFIHRIFNSTVSQRPFKVFNNLHWSRHSALQMSIAIKNINHRGM